MDWQLISGLVFIYLASGYATLAFQIKRYDAEARADRLVSEVMDDVTPAIQRQAMILSGIIGALIWPVYWFFFFTSGPEDDF